MTLKEIAEQQFMLDLSLHGKAIEAVSHLETHFPLQLAHIDEANNPNTWALNDSEKSDFLREIALSWNPLTSRKDRKTLIEKAMRNTAQSFNETRKMNLKHKHYNRHRLGRVIAIDSLKRTIKNCKGNEGLAEIHIVSFFERLLRLNDHIAQIRELKIMGGEDLCLCQPKRVIWVWFNLEERDDPYHGLRGLGKDLLRVLGLHDENKHMIIWTHEPPDTVSVRYSTVFDAALHPQWRPGGLSFPVGNEEGDFSSAVPEAVHDPVSVNTLKSPIMELDKL